MSQLKQINLSTPKYDTIIPSNNQSVKFSPFRVADEKVLLIASESKNAKQMMGALKSVIENCVEGVDLDKLAPFDLEFLFLKLRSVSVGETAELGLRCKECDTLNKVAVDISNVEVLFDENHTDTIKVSDDLIFKMKYPDVDQLASEDDSFESVLNLIAHSVETVFYGEEAITITDAEIPDLIDILNGLTSNQFKELQQFFETQPKLSKTVDYDCGECQHSNTLKLEGLANFF